MAATATKPRVSDDQFVALVLEQRGRWKAFVQARGFDEATADDIVSEAVLRGYRYLGAFRGEASLLSWMLTIILRETYTHFRRARYRIQTESLEDELVDGDTLSRPETTTRAALFSQVMVHVKRLTRGERLAIAYYLDGWDKPSRSVRVRKFRAVQKLRERLL
jgi:RNA polymerase sigma-70 factor (ECF subfamily)